MKLWVITETDTQSIMAISEDEKDILRYMKYKRFDETKYSHFYIKGETADNLMIHYEELYLEHDPEWKLTLTRIERKIVEDILITEKQKLDDTMVNIQHVVENYKLSAKKKKKLLTAYSILSDATEPKRLKKLIDIKSFVTVLGKGQNVIEAFRKKIQQASNTIFVLFNTKD